MFDRIRTQTVSRINFFASAKHENFSCISERYTQDSVKVILHRVRMRTASRINFFAIAKYKNFSYLLKTDSKRLKTDQSFFLAACGGMEN